MTLLNITKIYKLGLSRSPKKRYIVPTSKRVIFFSKWENKTSLLPHHFPYVQTLDFFTYSTLEVTFTLSKTQVPSDILFVQLLGRGNPRFIPIAFQEEGWCCRWDGRRLKRGIMCVRGKQSGMECPESIVPREDMTDNV